MWSTAHNDVRGEGVARRLDSDFSDVVNLLPGRDGKEPAKGKLRGMLSAP